MRLLSNTKRSRDARKLARINPAVVEAIESRILLTATTTAVVPGVAIESTGPFGTFMAVGFGTGSGSRDFSNWGFIQAPISAFNPTYTVNTSGGGVNSLSISLYNTATTGTFAPIAGDFDVYVLPDNDTSAGGPNPITSSSLIYPGGKSSTNTGLAALGSNFGTADANSLNTTAANLAGTFPVTSALPSGYSTFTLNGLSATVQSIIASDINTYNAGAGPTNTPISIAIVPSADGHPGFADWEGNFTPTGSENPKVQLDVNETPANTAEQYAIGATAAANGVTVNETAGHVLVDVVRTGFTGDATTLHYNTTADTAVDGTNYTGTQSGIINFVAGQTTAEISVPIINANFSGTNNFSVALTSDTPTQPGGTATISPASATVTIVGNASLTNNVGPVLASSTTIETSGPFSSGFAAVNGSTSNGTSSFSFLSYQVIQATPAPGSTVSNIQNVSLSLYNTDNTLGDNFDGHPGDFNIYYLPTIATPSTPATSSLKFNSTVDGVQGTTGAILLGAFSFQNTFGYDTYTASNLSATVQSDMAQDINGGTHSIRLAVAPGSANFAADWSGATLGQTPQVTLTATLTNSTEQFSIGAAAVANGVTVNENNANGAVLVDVARSGYTADAVTVDYSTTAGTAVDGANYTGTQSGTINFIAGQTTAEISVPIHNVDFAGSKTFAVTLTGVVGTASATPSLASPPNNAATVTIVGASSLTNNISNVPASSVGDIETSGLYTGSPTFAPVNGSIYSGTGSFGFLAYEVVELSPTSTPNVFPIPGSQVTNLSNLSLSMYNTATAGNYGGRVGDFNIYLLANTETTSPTSKLTFNTAFVDGVGTAAGATLLGTFSFDNNGPGYDVFTPATLSTTVSTTIINDLNSGTAFRLAVAPGSASFAADWAGVNQGQTPLVSLTDTIQVNQTEELISFQSATYSQSETGPVATITLTRSPNPQQTGGNINDIATVNYATSDGSAIAGGNYTASSGTATFAAGSATTNFTVPVIDVMPMGGDKFLNLSISSPKTYSSPGVVSTTTVGVLGNQTTAALTITDSSTAPTQILTPTLFDASDVEAAGPYDDFEIKATDVSGKFPSYGAIDFTPSAPSATITAIDSAILTVTNESGGSIAGPVKFYLVQDSTSNILPSSPQSRNPHFYDSTQGVEGFGTQFGAAHLLGSYTLTDVAGGDTINIPLAYTTDGERALIAALNNPSSNFRIVMTPENATVDADFFATTVALSVKVQEGTLVTSFGDVINGTGGADSITVVQDPNQPQQIDWTLNGGPISQLPASDPNGLTINGNGGNEVITVSDANGAPLPNTVHLNGTFTINNLVGTNSLAGTVLDIGRSTVFISYANAAADPLATIMSYLNAGYNGGTWTGISAGGVITSSAAEANPNHNTAIGYVDSADGTGINPAANTIELKYALKGDANLDTSVNILDLNILLGHIGTTGDSWDEGSFTYDASVNVLSLNILLGNIGTTLGNQAAPAAGASSATTTSLGKPALTSVSQSVVDASDVGATTGSRSTSDSNGSKVASAAKITHSGTNSSMGPKEKNNGRFAASRRRHRYFFSR